MPFDRKGSIEESISAANADVRHQFYDYFEQVVKATRACIWRIDLSDNSILFSEQMAELTGYGVQELQLLGFACHDLLILPADRERFDTALSGCITGRTASYEMEYRIVCRNGDIKWVQDRCTVVQRDEGGRPLRIIGMLYDISRFKQTEDALSEKVRILDTAASMSGLGTLNWDLRNNRMQYDDDFLRMFGYTPEETARDFEGLGDFIPPEDFEGFYSGMQQYISGQSGEESYSRQLRGRKKNGELLWVLAMARIVEREANGTPTRVYASVLDVDRLVRAELEAKSQLQENRAHTLQLQREIDTTARVLEAERRTREAMFEANPYMNLIFDSSFTVVDCNPAVLEFFGYPPDQKEQLLADIPRMVMQAIPAHQPNGKVSITYQQRMMDTVRDGYNEFETVMEFFGRQVTMRFVMIKIPYKNSFAVAVYQFDMTEIRKNEQELIHQEKMLQTVNATASLLMESDGETFLEALNQSLSMLSSSLGAQRAYIWKNELRDGRLVSTQLSEWVDSDSVVEQSYGERTICFDEIIPNWQQLLEDPNVSINAPRAQLPESLQSFAGFSDVESILLLPVESQGQFWGFLGFDDCVNKGRVFTQMEENIMRSAGMLIGAAVMRNEMTEYLIDAREAALESTRAKSDFLSRMSHEIRTPMNAIIGMTTIAQKTDDVDRMQYCLERIDGASRQLLDLINDVLDMSKIEANKMELSANEFNFEAMIRNVYNVVNNRVEEKQLNFSFEFESLFTNRVICDELRLSQVLINLINNAVKFTPQGGSITVRIGCEQHPSGAMQLNVRVQDSGIGIEPEQQERLFSAFEQADGSTTREYGGSGLGLAICRSIVHLMGGEIGVDSTPGEGSVFHFHVLFQWGGELPHLQAGAVLKKDLRILVVDDAEDVREYFHNLITGFSLRCVTAASGPQALQLVQRDPDFDLVFVDWMMPGMSGRETVWALRGMLGDAVPIILMSVADRADLESDVASTSVSGFLSKPVLPSTLYNIIVGATEQQLVSRPDPRQDKSYRWPDRRILLVEDIEINREILISILADTEVAIDCAGDGLEAVQRFCDQGDRYDLILMDVQMPKLNGLDATGQIRASGLFHSTEIPIIAMTANAFREDVERCLEAGMDDHIAKPINTDDLFAKLDRWMAGS